MCDPYHSPDDDRVIARIVLRLLKAFEAGQRPLKNRNTFIVDPDLDAVEAAAPAREGRAQMVLIGAENVNGKVLGTNESRMP